MDRERWKISWQRARLNRRYCDQDGHEFYLDGFTRVAEDKLLFRDYPMFIADSRLRKQATRKRR